MIRRATKIAIEVIGGLAAAGVIAAALLGWRLSQGPIPIDFLAPTIEESLSAPDGSFLVDVDAAMIVWGGWRRALRLQVEGVHVLGTERLLAELPEMVISVDLVRLLGGQVAPTHIEVTGPDIHVTRTVTGALDFGLGAEMLAPEQPDASDSGLQEALDLMTEPSAWGALSSLERLSVLRANLVLHDEALGLTWVASDATARLARTDGGLLAWVGATLELPDTEIGVRVSVDYDGASGTLEIDGNLDLAQPELLAAHVPALAPLRAAQLPLQARLVAVLGIDGLVRTADLHLQGRVGAVVLPDFLTQPVTVYSVDAKASLQDQRALGDWQGMADASGLTLTAALGLPRPDGSLAEAKIDVARAGSAPDVEVKMRVDAIAPPTVARLLEPALEPKLISKLGIVQAPVRGSALVRADLSGGLQQAWVDLLVDRGVLDLPEFYAEPLPLRDAALHATVTAADSADGYAIELTKSRIGFEDFDVNLDASMLKSPDMGSVELALNVPALAVDLFNAYWPAGVAVDPRRWVTANLSDGTVNHLNLTLTGDWEAEAAGQSPAFALGSLEGVFDVSGLTIRYSEKLPPARQGVAKVRFTPESFDFDVQSASLKGLGVTAGTVSIRGLAGDDHRIAISLDTEGPLRDVMEVIDGEPLRYARRIGHRPESFGGAVDARLQFEFPLLAALTFDEIDLDVTGTVSDLRIRNAVKDLDVDGGRVEVTLDNTGMDVSGAIRMDGNRLGLDWRENFEKPRQGPRFWSRYRVRGPLEAEDLTAFWPEITQFASGPMDLDVTYVRFVGDRSTVSVAGDLANTRLRVEALDWAKSEDKPARASLNIALEGDGVLGINDLDFEAEDAKAVGEIRMAPGSSEIGRVALKRLRLHGSDLNDVTLARDGGHWGVKVSSGRLDLSRFFPERSEDSEDAAAPMEDLDLVPVLPVSLDLDIGLNQLVIGADRVFGPLRAHVTHDGARWNKVAVRSRRGPTGNVRIDFLRGRSDGPELVALIDDFGIVARSFGVLDPLRNGRLLLTGGFTAADDPERFVGRLALTDFRLVRPPVLAQLLTLASLTGIVDLLSTESGLGFSKLESRFSYRDKVLSLNHARGFSQALGVTATGDINLGQGEIELEGTIAPAYVLSQVIETIPLLGPILSPKGEGLFAAIYEVDGDLSNPGFSVNPFSALAPGFLRNIFRSSPEEATTEGRAAGDAEDEDMEQWFQ